MKMRACLLQNLLELYKKKFLDPKAVIFKVWGLNASLGQLGPKVFGKGLIKPKIQKPSINFHK